MGWRRDWREKTFGKVGEGGTDMSVSDTYLGLSRTYLPTTTPLPVVVCRFHTRGEQRKPLPHRRDFPLLHLPALQHAKPAHHPYPTPPLPPPGTPPFAPDSPLPPPQSLHQINVPHRHSPPGSSFPTPLPIFSPVGPSGLAHIQKLLP